VWDKVNTSEMLMCSGSSTGAIFSGSDFNPYHVRTAPSDEIQGPLLGNIMVDDGYANVAVVWRSDEYGEGFGSSVADSVENAGATVVMREGYDHTQTSYADLASKIVASGADALAMIVFAEGGQIVLDLESAGFDGQIYVADGFVDNITADAVGGRTDLVEGFKGTYPALAPATGEATFVDRLKVFAPDAPTIFSAHKYDCLVTLVLAAQVAQSSDPTVFVDEVIGVTRGGEKCSLVEECLVLVWAGVDIDYDGASGKLDFSENGEPGVGTYDVFVYGPDMVSENLEQVEGSLG
jgi:branched-chain amino acid transport system substrate-binding protein